MRQVSFTLLMKFVAIVIQLSTRGTVDSDIWHLHLAEQPMVCWIMTERLKFVAGECL